MKPVEEDEEINFEVVLLQYLLESPKLVDLKSWLNFSSTFCEVMSGAVRTAAAPILTACPLRVQGDKFELPTRSDGFRASC